MKVLLKQDWIKDSQLKKWSRIGVTEQYNKCKCSDSTNHVELWEHDFCTRGRIDTIVCTECDSILNYKIIR